MSWYSDGENVTMWDLYRTGDADPDYEDDKIYLYGYPFSYEDFEDEIRRRNAEDIVDEFEEECTEDISTDQKYVEAFTEYYYNKTGKEFDIEYSSYADPDY